MEDALQIIKNDINIKNESKQVLKEFRKENLCNQAKQGEKLVTMMPGIKEAFNILRDDIYELGTENEELKKEIGEENIERVNQNVKKLLKESNNDEVKNRYVYNRMKQRQLLVKQLE